MILDAKLHYKNIYCTFIWIIGNLWKYLLSIKINLYSLCFFLFSYVDGFKILFWSNSKFLCHGLVFALLITLRLESTSVLIRITSLYGLMSNFKIGGTCRELSELAPTLFCNAMYFCFAKTMNSFNNMKCTFNTFLVPAFDKSDDYFSCYIYIFFWEIIYVMSNTYIFFYI